MGKNKERLERGAMIVESVLVVVLVAVLAICTATPLGQKISTAFTESGDLVGGQCNINMDGGASGGDDPCPDGGEEVD